MPTPSAPIAPGPPRLTVRGLRRTYGRLVALAGLDLDVAAGECVAMLGHNGSGKTTALRCIAGQLEADAGRVVVDGEEAADVHRGHLARAALAFVGDAPVFYRDLTVREHLDLVALAHGVGSGGVGSGGVGSGGVGSGGVGSGGVGSGGVDSGGVADGAGHDPDALLAEFDLAGRGDLLPRELSSGMAQKAQLACAFARPFRLLVLDEPALRLDPAAQRRLGERVRDVTAAGGGVLLTTHHLEFARGVADRAVVLADGEVALEGAYEDVIDAEEIARLGLR